MHPRELSIKDFSYHLPDDKIAEFPLPERDQSKLLVYKNGSINQDVYKNIAHHLPEDALLIFNNTRVLPARIIFQKQTGGTIEIFALEPHEQYGNITAAMQVKGKVLWKCLIGGAGKWKHGYIPEKRIVENGETIALRASIAARSGDSFTIEFSWEPAHLNFSEVLQRFGVTPIPPYLKRDSISSDQDRYQTIFATAEGSVAAPTAGLHFTTAIFESLQARNIQSAFITLHVGAGTFMPVKTHTLEGHNMHAEFMEVEKALLQKLAAHHHAIFAVGTTSLRTLESLYWMGVKCLSDPNISIHQLEITQWEVYDISTDPAITPQVALNALLSWMERTGTPVLIIKTSILIAPPYRCRLVCGLVTNFHQPNSTLLLLVAALIGDHWTKVYEYALNNDFRFLSYGDGCLLYV